MCNSLRFNVLILMGLLLYSSLLRANCKKVMEAHAKSQVKWGKGLALGIDDWKAYAKKNKISPPELTYVARHYGKTHRGDLETIAATKNRLVALKLEVLRLEEEMEPLHHFDPRYKKFFKELTKVTGDHQLQLEALEMMDWEVAWEFAYGKKEVIDSYLPEERYPLTHRPRPYPPQSK